MTILSPEDVQALTERIAALEQALDRQTQQFREIVQNAPLAVAMFDQEMRYLAYSPRWLRDYRLSERNLIGLTHYEVFPEIGNDWKAIHQRVLREGASDQRDRAPFPREDGTLDWVRWEVRPWYQIDGAIGGLLMYTEVITEQVTLHDELMFLNDHIDDMVVRVRLTGEFTFVTPSSYKLTGYRHYELLGHPATDWIHPDDHAEVGTRTAEALADPNVTVTIVYRMRHRDGHYLWVETSGSAIVDAVTGEPRELIGVIRDVTARVEAEQALRDSETRYRLLADSVQDMITRTDGESRYTYVSASVRTLLGYEPAALIGQTSWQHIHPDDLARLMADPANQMTTSGTLYTESRMLRADGSYVWVESTTRVVVDGAGSVVEYISVTRDISERKRAEEERERLIHDLKAATRMAREASRLKSEFLSTMSHELRTPLNAIEGFTSIMLRGMGVELPDNARSMVERVSVNSRRLLALINDFLDLSKIEAGRLQLVMAPLHLETLVGKWDAEVHVLAARKGLRFLTLIDPDLPGTLYGDEDALSKIASNLLLNAVKFTEQGEVTLALSRDGDHWIMQVMDTGIGIPPHAQEYIFDEFRQLDGSSKRQYGGTGLGLAIVRRLCQLMDGTVSVSSEVGRGSVFTVRLPLYESVAASLGA